jgi:hypothetical protein
MALGNTALIRAVSFFRRNELESLAHKQSSFTNYLAVASGGAKEALQAAV